VFRARDTSFNHIVVIKVLFARDRAELSGRFARGAQTIAKSTTHGIANKVAIVYLK
jgi:hypothetical protein